MKKNPLHRLLFETIRTEFILRDQSSFLGFLGTLINPIITFFAIYYIFATPFKEHTKEFGGYLLVGLMFWNLFSRATVGGASIVERRAFAVKLFSFPRIILPTADVFATAFSSLLESIVVLSIIFSLGSIRWSGVLLFFGALTTLIALSLGLSLILSTAGMFIRDVSNIWAMVLRLGFFVSPVFYPKRMLPQSVNEILAWNPIAGILEMARAILVESPPPSLGTVAYTVAFAGAVVAIGGFIFIRFENLFAERI